MDIEHLKAKCLPKRKNLESLGLFWDRYFAGKNIDNMAEVERTFRERARELQEGPSAPLNEPRVP